MTDNVPAVREEQPSRAPARIGDVARTDTDSWIGVLQNIGHLAELICETEFVPKNLRNSAPATAAAIMYGREVGLPPMTALTQTHVIEGKPAMSAEAMRAMVIAAGHELVYDETTGATCIMRARRSGSDHWTTLSWTIDMARAAGLTGKDNWKKYPRAMLISRCTADLCRMVFPDVIHGFRAVEELVDADESDEPGQPVQSTTTVRRATKKAPAKKAAALPAAPPPAERPAAPAGPPLPGEAGFDGPTQTGAAPSGGRGGTDRQTSAGVPDDGSPSSHEGESGEDTEDAPADVDEVTVDAATDTQAGESGEAGQDAAPADDPGSPEDPPAEVEPSSPRLITRAQSRMLFARFGELGVDKDDDQERYAILAALVSHDVTSQSDLTYVEASAVIDTLARFESRADLNVFLDELDAAKGSES